jgi:Fusaric acid resistance protein-like
MSGHDQSEVHQAEGNQPPTSVGGHVGERGAPAGSEPPAPGARGWTRSQRRLTNLIIAAGLTGGAGLMLVGTAVWAFTFQGVMSRALRGALHGHSLTAAGTLLLVLGVILLASAAGILAGPKVNRWVGLAARLVAIAIGAIGAISGVWLVAYYPGWAITYAVVGTLIVYTLTLYEKELRSSWPWTPLREQLAKVFALNTRGLEVPRAVALTGILLVTLVVITSLHQKDRYFLSVAFGMLFVTLSDPGGDVLLRLRRMVVVGVVGAALTALGFGVGGDAWGYVVLATIVVTVAAGLAINFGLQAFVAGILLNVWFLIALSAVAGLPSRVSPAPWNQTLAWLIGAAIAIGLMLAVWLVRGMGSQPSPLPEIPTDLPPIKLSGPIVVFVLIRAVAVSAGVGIAFGLSVSNADWMPVATLVAMKPNLEQSTFRGAQRLVGAALGAGIASLLLVTVTSHHALEELIIVVMGVAIAIHSVNYTFYAAGIAAAALMALDLPHPTNLDAEGRRIFFTFVGVAIAVVVMLLAKVVQDRAAAKQAVQHQPT